MKRQIVIMLLSLLSLAAMAQEQEAQATPKESKKRSAVYSGFSAGLAVHGGYLFSDDPRTVFSNTGLGSIDYVKGLPKSGLCYGIGAMARVHLINHIHLGAEANVSTMPLMSTGSNVRTAWGAALCDFYGNWGKVHPLIGLSIGGGTMKRLYVPDQNAVEKTNPTDSTTTIYNSSYVKTPFFGLDPYVGLEISIGKHMAVLIRLDYMLPFNISNTGLTRVGKKVKWDNFVTPSGPRLYVGLMLGKMVND